MQDKQQRLDELMAEYEKKEKLLQVLPVPYFKTGLSKKTVMEQNVKYRKLKAEVEELKKEISEVFYGG